MIRKIAFQVPVCCLELTVFCKKMPAMEALGTTGCEAVG